MESLKLYNYYRSSASYRVRIALHYKNIPFEYIPIHLVKNGGEQHTEDYRKLNPKGEVPCLITPHGPLAQSMAILMYLDAAYPETPMLFPKNDPLQFAKIIEVCEMINSGIQPIQNIRVTQYLAKNKVDQGLQDQWVPHWIREGFNAFEKKIENTAQTFCFGDQLTAADIFLVPQVFNALRFRLDLSNWPNIQRVYAQCLLEKAIQKAAPENQPDFMP